MGAEDLLKLLKSVRLLDQIPDKPLAALAEFLKPLSLPDGAVVFEEGQPSDSLYFVTSGQVRISKKIAGASKDLALLGPGDCFGEMALIDAVKRSATASAVGETRLFRLSREDMNRWLKSHPEQALEFFAELAQVQSARLRRTSSELALLFDLSSLLLERAATPAEVVRRSIERVLPHLEGSWTASAYLYNRFNGDTELVAGPEAAGLQDDECTLIVPLPAAPQPHGYLVFRSAVPLAQQERADLNVALTTTARLLSAAVENVNHRLEEGLRARLRSSTHGASL